MNMRTEYLAEFCAKFLTVYSWFCVTGFRSKYKGHGSSIDEVFVIDDNSELNNTTDRTLFMAFLY